ncbi:unnamed protein product [Fusarium graminearum]|nr:unnamed protein product [Fusarium graminearum]
MNDTEGVPLHDYNNADPFSQHEEELSPFWIPPWLNTPNLVSPNGLPTKRLRQINTVMNWSLIAFPLIPILCLVALALWSKVDENLCPKIIKCKDPCVVEADPDIAGIGVRIATYTQTICNIILLGFASDGNRTSASYHALVLTSLATIITLGIFSIQTKLSLHHSVVASSLLTITILPTHILESWRVRSPGIFVAQQVRLAIYCAYAWWLILEMPCMGAEPQCNLCTRSSLFGHASRVATHGNRSLRLGVVLFTSYLWLRQVVWSYGPRHYFESVPATLSETRKQAWNSYIDENRDSLTTWRLRRLARERKYDQFSRFLIPGWLWYDDVTTARRGIEQRRWKRFLPLDKQKVNWFVRVWEDATVAIRVPRCQRAIVALLLSVLLISDTEHTVKLNLSADRDQWGYGQILALVATIPSVADVTRLLLRLGKRPYLVIPFKENIGNCGNRGVSDDGLYP